MEHAPACPVYLAILPDHAARERTATLIRQIVREHGFTHGLQRLDRLHITMLRLGTWHGLPGDLLPRVAAMASRLDWPTLPIRFDRIGNLGRDGGGRYLVLQCADRPEPLHELHRRLVSCATMAGLSPKSSSSGLKPHMTLVYNHRQPFVTRAIGPVE